VVEIREKKNEIRRAEDKSGGQKGHKEIKQKAEGTTKKKPKAGGIKTLKKKGGVKDVHNRASAKATTSKGNRRF